MTSVDNSQAIGVDVNLGHTLKGLHAKVDALINNIDLLIENTKNFK